jgi:hypothetical protein
MVQREYSIIQVIQHMKPHVLQFIKQRKGGNMESIDVRDLPEEEARLVAAFVEFLKRRRLQQYSQPMEAQEEQPLTETAFAVWPLGVKGTLSREETYDHL